MTIRPARQDDIPSIARVHVDSWQTTYRGIVADSFLDALTYQKHEERHRRYIVHPGTVYFVAELPDAGIVGFLSGGPHRGGDADYRGELYAIYLLEQYRRRGIGAALVRQWAENIQSHGMDSALVWVLAENKPAIEFYQHLGAKPLREQMIDIGAQSLKEIAFGWNNLSKIRPMTSTTPPKFCGILFDLDDTLNDRSASWR